MNFIELFKQSNLSLNKLQGNVIQSSLTQTRGNKVSLDTGLKEPTVCVQNELNTVSSLHKTQYCIIAVENVELFGEPKVVLPRTINKIRKRKLVWTQLEKIWHSSHNRIRGFILNGVKGGYAVAIAGYTAFLPRSLRIGRKVQRSQWRLFSILNMNPKLKNIVVKELATTKLRRGRLFFWQKKQMESASSFSFSFSFSKVSSTTKKQKQTSRNTKNTTPLKTNTSAGLLRNKRHR
jgi:ribosomal protein S1